MSFSKFFLLFRQIQVYALQISRAGFAITGLNNGWKVCVFVVNFHGRLTMKLIG